MPGWLVLLGPLSLGALAGWLGGYLLMLAARWSLHRLHLLPRAASRLFLPLALLVGTVVAGLLLRAVQPDRFQGALQAPLVVPLLLFWLVLAAIDLVWEKVGRRHARVQPGFASALLLVRRVGKALVVGVGLAFLLDRLGVPLGGFFLAAGAIGAALGFAARSPMENLFGSGILALREELGQAEVPGRRMARARESRRIAVREVEMDFWTYLQDAVSGPGALRFVLQPAVALLLAIRDGRQDARAGTRPFFERLLFEPWERGALARNAIGTLLVPLCIAFALDSFFQLLLTGQWRLVRAVVVGLLLVGLPYSLFRGLSARAFRVEERRRTRRQA